MKRTIIPAQITTVEDRFAANLTLSQLITLSSALFLDIFLFLILPKFAKLDTYKVVTFTLIDPVIAALAYRYKEDTLLNWLKLIHEYRSNTHIYIFDKNTDFNRPGDLDIETETEPTKQVKVVNEKPIPMAIEDRVKAYKLLDQIDYEFKFAKSKGAEVNVQIIQNR
jgi:hypothetical protein